MLPDGGIQVTDTLPSSESVVETIEENVLSDFDNVQKLEGDEAIPTEQDLENATVVEVSNGEETVNLIVVEDTVDNTQDFGEIQPGANDIQV